MSDAARVLTGRDLSLEAVAALTARAHFTLDATALAQMAASRDAVERAVARGQVSYGITTGFGAFANRHIPEAKVRELQANLVRSHSVGVGAPLAARHVRRSLRLKANTLAAGHSGIRPAVAETLVDLGVDFGRLSTLRNLKHGLREALRLTRREREGLRAEDLDQDLGEEPARKGSR